MATKPKYPDPIFDEVKTDLDKKQDTSKPQKKQSLKMKTVSINPRKK